MLVELHVLLCGRRVPSVRRYTLRAIIWLLVISMVVPVSLFAQMAPGISNMPNPQPSAPSMPSAMPAGVGAGGSGPPILTAPNALQPIVPYSLPCPVPQPEPTPSHDQGAFGRQTLMPGASGSPGPSFGGQPSTPTGALVGGGPATGMSSSGMMMTQGPTASPLTPGGTAGFGTAPGLSPQSPMAQGISPLGQMQATPGIKLEGPGTRAQQPGDPLLQISAGMLGQLQPERVEPKALEESFASRFIRQGMEGKLKQFGYNFFDTPFPGFAPIMDVPVGPDYVLGPGDTLTLHIWNVPDATFNRTLISPIDRDGTIFIPQIGPIPIAGATFSQATRLIQSRLAGHLKKFDLHVAMARLRTIKVFVVGDVVRPGAYELSSLGTISHALYSACGPSKSGSLRKIRLVRDGKVEFEADFYKFLLGGDRSHDIRLQSGDTIFVPPIGPVAAVAGPVRRPAIYEIKQPMKLTELIELAGGLHPTAGRRRCQIFRIELGERHIILDADLSELLDVKPSATKPVDPLIEDGDILRIATVPSQIENIVSLTGAVRDAGPYEYRIGMRIRDILTPEQMLIDSFWDKAELVRVDPMTYEAMVYRFSPRDLFKGLVSENLELQRLDKIVVYTQVQTPRIVTIKGEVRRPGTYTIETGERLSAVLQRTGGLTQRAFPKGIVIIRESVRRNQQTEIEKFVLLQKQTLISESAGYSLGLMSVAVPGMAGGGAGNPIASTLQMQLQALDQLMLRVQPGRVVVKINSLEELEGTNEDIALEDGDQIMMPERPRTVTIMGAVRNPTSVVHENGLRFEDYVRKAGGVTPDGSFNDGYILRADGTTESTYVKVKEMLVGDTIVVPIRVEPKIQPLPFWASVFAALGGLASVATAAAALVVLGKQ